MAYVFLVLVLVSIVCLILGLIRPSIVKCVSRGRVFRIFGSAFLISFIALLIAVPNPDQSITENSSNATPSNTPEAVAVISVTADKLMNDYTANEVSADVKYKNKVVQVTGTVKSIGKDITDTAYIALATGGEYSITAVQCMFGKSSESALVNVSKGNHIALQGKVSGKFGNIILSDCKIVE